MTWNELRESAKKILENVPTGAFEDKSFATRSGGSPRNSLEIPEIHRSDAFQYRTTANGPAYAGEVVIRCRKTGAFDRHGRTIYESGDGTLFVYKYRGGSPMSFDRGEIDSPEM